MASSEFIRLQAAVATGVAVMNAATARLPELNAGDEDPVAINALSDALESNSASLQAALDAVAPKPAV